MSNPNGARDPDVFRNMQKIADRVSAVERSLTTTPQKVVIGTLQYPLQNSWVYTSGQNRPTFYKDLFNRVFVEGSLSSGVTNTAAFTLPYPPVINDQGTFSQYYSAMSDNGVASSYLHLDASGVVVITRSTTAVYFSFSYLAQP